MKIRSTPGVLVACTVTVLAIGWLDYVTGREIHFGFFYLLPIIVATFMAGRRSGFAVALLSMAIRTAVDRYSGNSYPHFSILVWNTCIRLFTFLTVAYLAGWIPQRPGVTPPRVEKGKPAGPKSKGMIVPYENRLPVSNKVGRLLWTIVWSFLFRPTPQCLHGWRALLLRCFGARIGRRCTIDSSCRIWAPWNLEIGHDCHLDAGVDCYSVARITIGDRTIVSQGAYLCSASHDFSAPDFPLTQAPIQIGSDVWIAARVFVRHGIVVGEGGVVGACAVVTKNVEPWTVVAGSPARVVKRRVASTADAAGQPPVSGADDRVTVGIVTFHLSENYGALLQAYALQKVIERIGCHATIIDYQPHYLTTGGKWLWPFSRRNIYADAGVLLIKVERVRSFLIGRKRRRRFQEFRAQHLRLTASRYKTLQNLRERLPAFDVLVCGSDQIWNPPPRFGVDPAFYLAFGPRTCRRVTFAPSFGGAQVEPRYREEIGRLLAGLDALSVRERSGLGIIEELTGRRAAWMPDPTMLLENYEDLLVRPAEADFIFTYCLRTSRSIGHIQAVVAQRLGLPVITPANPGKRWVSSGHIVRIGPTKWLGYMAHARIVITNSFHGTVFSILFRKPFIAVSIQGRKSNLNERLTSLLDRLGLAGRFIDENTSDDDVRRLLDERIDWDVVHARLQTWRAEAWAYLREEVAAVRPDVVVSNAGMQKTEKCGGLTPLSRLGETSV